MSDVVLDVKGLLFDLDGVFVDSTESVERHWRMFAEKYNLDAEELLTKIHGVPPFEIIPKELADRPDEIDSALKWHADLEEADAPNDKELPGGRELVATLPDHNWAIVTSCWEELARLRAKAAGVELPKAVVTADQIDNGKPAPDGYLKGAELIGVDPKDCLVFEDAPSGIEAGNAAGATVIALRTTSPEAKLNKAAHVIDDLSKVSVKATGKGFEVHLQL